MKDYDSAWKDIIKAYFTSFLSFYFPRVADDLDLTKSPVFLDKELQRLSPGNSAPGRLADLLVRVTSRSGEPRILYTHVEVQGRKEPGFAERLFQYAYRIYDKFQSFPITLVLLTDDDPEFLPTKFEITDNNRSLRVDFNTAKLLYFREESEAPEKQENPFAFVTAAQLEANALRRRRRKGAAKEEREVLIRMVERKFGLTPEERSRIAEEVDVGKLDAALDAFVFAETKDEVLKLLD